MGGALLTRRGKRVVAMVVVIFAMAVDHCASASREADERAARRAMMPPPVPPVSFIVAPPPRRGAPTRPEVSLTSTSTSPHPSVYHQALASLGPPEVSHQPSGEQPQIPTDWQRPDRFRPALANGIAAPSQFHVAIAVARAVRAGARRSCTVLPPLGGVEPVTTGAATASLPSQDDWTNFCRALSERKPARCSRLGARLAPDLRAECTRYFQPTVPADAGD